MIAIISSSAPERQVIAALCEARQWVWIEGDSIRALSQLLKVNRPRAIVARHRLLDGYSDDIVGLLRARGLLAHTKLVVLTDAALSSHLEARQIELGVDHVHRDPVRIEVLLAYLQKFNQPAAAEVPRSPAKAAPDLVLAGVRINPLARSARHGRRHLQLTQREIELAELLAASNGTVVTYPILYHEILGRRFRGDTSNLRVLLGKLAASLARIGADLRAAVEVIPKTGYRLRPALAVSRTAARTYGKITGPRSRSNSVG